MLTKEQQLAILEEHYQQCFDFWKREKYNHLPASAMALIDIVQTKRNPFMPMGEFLDVEVRRTIVEKLLQKFCEDVRMRLRTPKE